MHQPIPKLSKIEQRMAELLTILLIFPPVFHGTFYSPSSPVLGVAWSELHWIRKWHRSINCAVKEYL